MENKNIRGITVHGVENVLGQFADDTSAYLEYSNLCVNSFLETMSRVEAQIGLKISYDKTTIYRIGSIKESNARLYTTKELKWSDGPIETLGVKIPSIDRP